MKQQIQSTPPLGGGLEVGCSKCLIHKPLDHHTTYTTMFKDNAGGSVTGEIPGSLQKGWWGGLVVYS